MVLENRSSTFFPESEISDIQKPYIIKHASEPEDLDLRIHIAVAEDPFGHQKSEKIRQK